MFGLRKDVGSIYCLPVIGTEVTEPTRVCIIFASIDRKLSVKVQFGEPEERDLTSERC